MKNEESRFAQNEESLLQDEEFAASNENSSFSREAGILHSSLKRACAR